MTTRNPFKQRDMARVFDAMLAAARDPKSELYHADGSPRTGAMQRCAFWDGYFLKPRTAHAAPGTLAWACFRAGQAFRREKKQ